MQNALQIAAGKLSNWIDRMAREFERLNTVGHQMTGSGTGYFGVFRNRVSATTAARRISSRLPAVWVRSCHTIGSNSLLKTYRPINT